MLNFAAAGSMQLLCVCIAQLMPLMEATYCLLEGAGTEYFVAALTSCRQAF
jgi:hypothetical protein